MKHITRSCLGVAVLAALALLTTAAYAKDGCSVATLKGNYAMTFSGFVVVNNTSQPFYGEGLLTFDGVGNVAGPINYSPNGVPNLNSPYTATYTVNPDCTGVVNGLNDGDSVTFVILDDGAEIFATDISAPWYWGSGKGATSAKTARLFTRGSSPSNSQAGQALLLWPSFLTPPIQ